MPQQAMYGVYRDFPDAGEAEDAAGAADVEVFRRFTETLHPSHIAVFLHDILVIGGEVPALSVHRETVGWCAGLSAQVEIVGFYPCPYVAAIDADGDVVFQCDAVGACVLNDSE